MLTRWFFILLWLATVPAFTATFTVTVKVVNASNQPVAKADVGLFWQVNGGMTPMDGRRAITDENGKAVLRVDDWNEKRAVLILSADRALGGIVGVSNADDGRELIAVVGPTVRVKGKLECTELNSKPKWANTMVTPDGFRAQVAQDMGESAKFEFILPTGKYAVRSYGSDVEDIKQTITLTTDQSEHDFGTLDMKASPIAKLKGKTAPGWSITAARGVKPNAKLSDYKGRWVYLEFWGFW